MTAPAELPHHDGSVLFVAGGAEGQRMAIGDVVGVRLRVPKAFGPVTWVRVRSNPDREPVFAEATIVGSTELADWWQASVTIENPIHRYRFVLRAGDGHNVWVNASGVHDTEPRDVDDFRLTTFAPAPAWAKSTVLYQVFPDRFGRSALADGRPTPEWAEPAGWTDAVVPAGPSVGRQLYGGDLDGIVEHLDHIVRLGATVLYLTPFFEARSNHRYDAASFDRVDPLLGGDAALVRLVRAAHAHGLRVIGDLTTNHSGDGHEWFRAAYGHPQAPESEFYYWLDDEHTEYASWLGHRSLPKFDWNSRELRSRFIEGEHSVVAHWLKPPFDLDGWRIDVANMTGRYRDDDLNAEVRQTIRATMLGVKPDTILLAESTNDAAPDFQGDAWHGAMTYANFTRPLWEWLQVPASPAGGGLGMVDGMTTEFTARQFVRAHTEVAAEFPWRVQLATMNALDTHDTPRFATHARQGVVPVAVGLSVTMPGIPVVWAGDEFGLTASNGEESRTPLPWNHLAEHAESLSLYRELIALRRSHAALNEGGMSWLALSDDAVAFVREHPRERVLVVAARASAALEFEIEGADAASSAYGDTELQAMSATLARVQVDGPAFGVWTLPPVDAPWAG